MNFFDLFRSSNSGQQQQSQKPQQQVNNQQQPNKDGQPVNFPGKDNAGELSGLDLLAQLSNNGGNQPKPQAPAFSLDQAKLGEHVKGMKFADSVPPELLQAFQGGDVNALMQIMNHVGQQAYMAALQNSAGLVDGHLNARLDYERNDINSQVRSQLVSSQLKDINKLHPMAQVMFKNAAANLAQQFPNASPEEIQNQVWSMLEGLGSQFNRTAQTAAENAPKEQDWDTFGGFAEPSQSNAS